MKLVFFTHPPFFASQSMPRFARMLTNGMTIRGHDVEVWTPQPKFYRVPFPGTPRKWLGYIDQFILFPREVRQRLKKCSSDTLFVFADNALGPWVPLVADRPHVIHCHDFLAQRSALGEIPENRVSWSGRQYQALINRGYIQGKNFISGSKKTEQDLRRFLKSSPLLSNVIYNGLNQPFIPLNQDEARHVIKAKTQIDVIAGYLLHVGGNQYYKNRIGVIDIYDEWRKTSGQQLPLLLVGPAPSVSLLERHSESAYKDDIHFLTGMDNQFVRLAYGGASVFLFPSLDEGFGWPIAEAMASGCPVITTNAAPMTEVAGDAGFLISRKPYDRMEAKAWAREGAEMVNRVIDMTASERKEAIQNGLINSKRFDQNATLDSIEIVYQNIIKGK